MKLEEIGLGGMGERAVKPFKVGSMLDDEEARSMRARFLTSYNNPIPCFLRETSWKKTLSWSTTISIVMSHVVVLGSCSIYVQ